MTKIPRRFEAVLFGLVLSGLMSCLVSGISTLRTMGLVEGFAHLWLGAWLTAWLVAFPVALVIAPVTRKIVRQMVTQE